MTPPEAPESWQPRYPAFVAAVLFVLVALTIFYPLFSGQFLAGDDQLGAGYAFRLFGAEMHKATGSIPQWNPFILGGVPFSAVVGHGDIFYPTAWLRWFVPTDLGMTLGFFFHIILAGVAMYALLRGLKLAWGAAVVGGVAYQLSGIVASQMSPGHDGKLFVSSMAPLAFLALLRAIRHGRLAGYGGFALVVGLAILSPQVQMAYYLMVASGIWTLWLAFFDPERRTDRPGWQPVALAAVAVLIGVGIAAVQVIPILSHTQYTPRGPGGPSVGWEYNTAYAMPIEELMTTILPQFNGMLDGYWGQNFFKSHTEYLGAIVVVLAVLGVGAARKRGLLTGLGIIGALFLLVSFGGHTPFYRLWILMPMMSSVRAAGMAFYLVALPVCVWAALGAERLLRREASGKSLLIALGVVGGVALLGVAGLLQGVATSLASAETMATAVANAPELRAGSLRLLLVVLLGGGVLIAIQRGILKQGLAVALLALVVAGDNWSILHHFAKWYPPASVTFADDEITTAMRKTPLPFRALDAPPRTGANVYIQSVLMGYQVPQLLGYFGMESKYFDELMGGKNEWVNILNPTFWDLYAVKYFVVNQDVPSVPGYHKVLGPVSFPHLIGRNARVNGLAGFLYERDSTPQWVRVVPAAAKVPEDRIVPTIIDPRFPLKSFVLYPDTSSIVSGGGNQTAPAPTSVKAELAKWQPGAMTVKLSGTDTRTTYLMVAENWYPDWKATIDGEAVQTHRADFALLSVALPPGAKEVTFTYDSTQYHQMMWVSWACALLALGLLAAGRFRPRTNDA
ncbi:MAG: hypothetical protein ABIZ70_07150 [Gemmatimonadales bacterium]